MNPMRVGIIGCGNISTRYLATAELFPILDVVACADLLREKAEVQAEKFGLRAVSVDDLLADQDIELVINLTIPAAHADVAGQVIEAGKHVYNEKPMAHERDAGRQMLEQAAAKGVRVGGAPDTFLGAAWQTARRLIDEGAIGRPLACTAFMMGRGHETWHPNPEFYYEPGGGPMMDMGPYYLTALVHLLGPMRRVTGSAGILIPERTITSQPKHGQKIAVQTPDHITGSIDFADGALGTIAMSFATAHCGYGGILVIGEEGSINAGDPNGFDGEVRLARRGEKDWEPVEPAHPTGYQRIAGVAEMAHAIRAHRPHRCHGEMTFSVLDAMVGFLDAAATGRAHDVAPCPRPAAVPADLPFGTYEG